jgi:hypothetical protein
MIHTGYCSSLWVQYSRDQIQCNDVIKDKVRTVRTVRRTSYVLYLLYELLKPVGFMIYSTVDYVLTADIR